MKALVIGGGLAGLTTAFDLANAGADVTVHEASPRWGGKIFSSAVGDRVVDAGPDSFLARVPDAIELCADLDLTDQLTIPVAPVPAYIYVDRDLVPLPAGTVLGVPTDFDALQGVISPAGIERAKADLHLPATPLDDHTTVDFYCRERLGDEVTDVLIDPMVGGINASSIQHLSLADGAAQLHAAAQRGSSLIAELREARASIGATLGSAAADQPVFHGLQGGIATMVERLVERLSEMGVDLRLSSPVTQLSQGEFDHIIVAVEAHAAATLLEGLRAGDLLGQIQHASVAQLTIEVPAGQLEALDASGVLVPRSSGLLMTACTWFSTKWAQYDDPTRRLVRSSAGRYQDQRALEMDDGRLESQLLQDFGTIFGDSGPVASSRIVRWPNAFPQYQPGHRGLVDQAMSALADERPDIHLVGNSYRGIGIPATIKLARQTAARITSE